MCLLSDEGAGSAAWKWSISFLLRRNNNLEVECSPLLQAGESQRNQYTIETIFRKPPCRSGRLGIGRDLPEKTEAVGLAGGRLGIGRDLPEKTEVVGLAGGRLGIGRDLPAEGKHGRDD